MFRSGSSKTKVPKQVQPDMFHMTPRLFMRVPKSLAKGQSKYFVTFYFFVICRPFLKYK
jgi:hypothetical protein